MQPALMKKEVDFSTNLSVFLDSDVYTLDSFDNQR